LFVQLYGSKIAALLRFIYFSSEKYIMGVAVPRNESTMNVPVAPRELEMTVSCIGYAVRRGEIVAAHKGYMVIDSVI
jgi:hypothetical protein